MYGYLLSEKFISDQFLEIFSRKLRNHLLNLFETDKKSLISNSYNELILYSLAQQCFLNEYIWTYSKKENDICNKLLDYISKNILTDNKILIYLYASYRYIGKLDLFSEIIKKTKKRDVNFKKFIDLQLYNAKKEAEIMKTIKSFSKISDKTSLKVQSQYEENPYPRWIRASVGQKTNYIEYIKQQIHPSPIINPKQKANHPKVLVAGCGTGRHTLYTATSIKGDITSIDISKASLAYAKREMEKRDITDIDFIHGDILDVSNININYDIIESIGVLHHMKNPEKGLESLLKNTEAWRIY